LLQVPHAKKLVVMVLIFKLMSVMMATLPMAMDVPIYVKLNQVGNVLVELLLLGIPAVKYVEMVLA